jgi:hypothetical protein
MVQRNTREIVLGSALIILPGVVLTLVATTLTFDNYQSLKGSIVSVPELLGGREAGSGIEELLVYIGLLLNSIAAALVGGYVATLAIRRQLGLRLSIATSYRALLPRIPTLLAAWALGHFWIPLAGLALGGVDGSSWGPLITFGVPAALVAVTMTVVTAPAIIVERLGPLAGTKRAWRMARANFGTLFGFVVASVLIGLLVQYGIAYLPRLLQGTGLVTFGRFGWLIEGVAGQLGRLISMPLVATATALVYLEVRMKTEGLDLVIDADRAFGPPS